MDINNTLRAKLAFLATISAAVGAMPRKVMELRLHTPSDAEVASAMRERFARRGIERRKRNVRHSRARTRGE